MNLMKVVWPRLGAEVRIQPLLQEAPHLAPALMDGLPFETVQGHALITGPMLFAPTRVSTPVRENVTLFTDMPVGACWYGSASQNVGIVYGPLTEPEGFSVWGQVHEDDLATLADVGRAVWENLMRPNGHPAALDETNHALAPHKELIVARHSLIENT